MSETTKVVHCKVAKYDVYIGRGSPYGNFWSHKEGTTAKYKVATRTEAIRLHKEWLLTQPYLLMEIRAMKGKTLGCWCKHQTNPLACHGDTFAEIADMPEAEFQELFQAAKKLATDNKVEEVPRKLERGKIPFSTD